MCHEADAGSLSRKRSALLLRGDETSQSDVAKDCVQGGETLAFLAGDFLAGDFLAGDFLAAGAFLAGDFLAAAGFLAAGAFLAGDC